MVFLLLGIVLGLLVGHSAATCSTLSNTDYSSAGNLVTLFGVTSAAQCCAACSGFEECKYYSWTSSNSQCFPKTSASTQVTANGIVGGVNSATYTRPTTCTSENGFEYYFTGGSLNKITTTSSSACCSACQQYTGCNYWVLKSGTCYLQTSKGLRRASTDTVSGTVIPPFTVTARTGKRGLGVYGTNSCSDMKLLNKVSWVYNWAGQPGALEECYRQLGIDFVPMVWGLSGIATIGDLYTNSKYLLTFNEPNFPQQSNMSPQQAANAWPTIQTFAKQYGMKIGSPSASYGGSNMDPLAWLDAFFAACPGCQVDFINTHQYDCRPYDCYGALGNFKKYNKPIWVTEFGCFSSTGNSTSFVNTIVPLFENDAQFERYSYFGSRANENYVVFNPSKAALTPIGVTYTTL